LMHAGVPLFPFRHAPFVDDGWSCRRRVRNSVASTCLRSGRPSRLFMGQGLTHSPPV
jgi:hypothetical protein